MADYIDFSITTGAPLGSEVLNSGDYQNHLQGRSPTFRCDVLPPSLLLESDPRDSWPLRHTLLAYSSTMKVESVVSSETSVDFYRTTRGHVSDDGTLQAFFSPTACPLLLEAAWKRNFLGHKKVYFFIITMLILCRTQNDLVICAQERASDCKTEKIE
jgi:hypothetical protein